MVAIISTESKTKLIRVQMRLVIERQPEWHKTYRLFKHLIKIHDINNLNNILQLKYCAEISIKDPSACKLPARKT